MQFLHTDVFNKRRLLANTLAAWEEQLECTKMIVLAFRQQVVATKKSKILAHWRRITVEANNDLNVKENQGLKFGKRLILRQAISYWRSRAFLLKKDREMERLVAEKMKEVNRWLRDPF